MEMERRGFRVAQMAAQNVSVMAVREGTQRNAIERAVIVDGSLRIGSPCNVEFGAVTAFVGSGPIRIEGQWRRCQVISVEGGIVARPPVAGGVGGFPPDRAGTSPRRPGVPLERHLLRRDRRVATAAIACVKFRRGDQLGRVDPEVQSQMSS